MIENKKPSKRKKISFEGVNPDLLRATVPEISKDSNAPPKVKIKKVQGEESTQEKETPSIKDLSKDPYGLRKGKEACLRSVLQRLRTGQMSAVEEARAMFFLIENQVVSNQAILAKAMSKPKSKVSEKLSILKLPRSVQLLMERHPTEITAGHAVELLRLKDPALISSAAGRILDQRLTRDRLRTEISFLLDKHGHRSHGNSKRSKQSKIRYFPKVDGGFDLIYRFRPDGDQEDLEKMIVHMDTKVKFLKQILSTKLEDERLEKAKEKANSSKEVKPLSNDEKRISI